MLMKKSERAPTNLKMAMAAGNAPATVNRRAFLRNSGIAAAGAGLASLPLTMVKKTEAAGPAGMAKDGQERA